ncbi:hypothetical protein DIJ63_39055, partial [Burkholderia pseudomallei]
MYKDNSVYEGEYKDGKKSGVGTYTCESYRYIGEWKDDKKSGIGTYYLLNGTKIEVCIKDEIITKGELIREGKENK